MIRTRYRFLTILIFSLLFLQNSTKAQDVFFKLGAEQFSEYLPLLKNKNVAIVANQTSMIGNIHLVDTLISQGVRVKKIFSPEHGFRGTADAGEHVSDNKDVKTGLSLISLYGSHKKPTIDDLDEIDIVIFDIQDVGVRFYTYTSTMHFVMEACAENEVKVIVLDRPNPNGHYIDGPILDLKYRSFVGMHPVPVVHGLTIGEYAKMINGEGWLKNDVVCDLTVIPCKNYSHNMPYELPIKPSPNLPNMTSIYLYPTLCFFEGTKVSVGRGTDFPFQVYGHPDYTDTSFSYIPRSIPGASKNPKFKGVTCYGKDLRTEDTEELRNTKAIQLELLVEAYKNFPDKDIFFQPFFLKLAGNTILKEQIIAGTSAEEIRSKWKYELQSFQKIRNKYLLYKDFD